MSERLERLDVQKSELLYRPLWWHKQGLSYTASGYGGKIPTPHKIRHNNREKRVYCMCYSNSGTLYILNHGKRLILDIF